MMNHNINDIIVETDGDLFTRVVVKPLAGHTKKIKYIKLDDVYIYFPEVGKVIITKDDINSF